MSYENNNDANRSKCKPKISVTPAKSTPPPSRKAKKCSKAHVNCLWSVWYGLCLTGFQAYIATQCAKRFYTYASLPWPSSPPPRLELHAYIALLGTAVLILPFFLISAVFKIGNLANDGFKLGRHLSTCTADPPSVLLGELMVLFFNFWKLLKVKRKTKPKFNFKGSLSQARNQPKKHRGAQSFQRGASNGP